MIKNTLKNTIYIASLIIMLFTFLSPAFAKNNNEIPLKIGVNRFAWYAALQTINFMPVAFVDPFAGAILTEWYSLNGKDRYKVDIYILEESLTATTVQVRVFKQVKRGNVWEDTQIPTALATKIEDSILNTARELRIRGIMSEK